MCFQLHLLTNPKITLTQAKTRHLHIEITMIHWDTVRKNVQIPRGRGSSTTPDLRENTSHLFLSTGQSASQHLWVRMKFVHEWSQNYEIIRETIKGAEGIHTLVMIKAQDHFVSLDGCNKDNL